MTEDRKRFETLINRELEAAKSGNGAFAAVYKDKKAQWRGAERDKILESQTLSAEEKINQIDKLDAKFDETQLPEINKELKAKTLKAYDGQSTDEQLEGVASKVSDKASNVLGGMATSLFTGGNPIDAANIYTKHGLIGLVMGIPFVGEFLGQVMSFLGNKVKRLFGSTEPSLSWSQAGEKVERENRKERISTEMNQVADVKRLAVLVDDAAKPPSAEEVAAEATEAAKKPATEAPATGRAALDTDKDGKIKASELDVNKDGMLTSADKEPLAKQMNDADTAKKLFEELGQQGVTFDNQKVSDLTTQNIPAVLPSGASPSK